MSPTGTDGFGGNLSGKGGCDSRGNFRGVCGRLGATLFLALRVAGFADDAGMRAF